MSIIVEIFINYMSSSRSNTMYTCIILSVVIGYYNPLDEILLSILRSSFSSFIVPLKGSMVVLKDVYIPGSRKPWRWPSGPCGNLSEPRDWRGVTSSLPSGTGWGPGLPTSLWEEPDTLSLTHLCVCCVSN